jgi:hypothetical protein
MPDGTRKQTNSTSEVVATGDGERTSNPALFEIPTGFKPVQRIGRNLMSASSRLVEDLWQRLKASLTRVIIYLTDYYCHTTV